MCLKLDKPDQPTPKTKTHVFYLSNNLLIIEATPKKEGNTKSQNLILHHQKTFTTSYERIKERKVMKAVYLRYKRASSPINPEPHTSLQR